MLHCLLDHALPCKHNSADVGHHKVQLLHKIGQTNMQRGTKLTGLKRTDAMESAPQLKLFTGSDRSWSQISTWDPAVAKLLRPQWWSIPLKAPLPRNSKTGLSDCSRGPASPGAKGTFQSFTVQSVLQDTQASPSCVMLTPLTSDV